MANELAAVKWDLDAGGIPSEDDLKKVGKKSFRQPPTGVFAAFPGYTPKYALNVGTQETDFRETMARMFLPVTDYAAFVESFNDDQPLQQIAEVLVGETTEQSGTTGGPGYVDFLLQNVQHAVSEKTQVVETLSDSHVAYFFGQAAPTFQYSGTLINTKQDDQAMNMLRLYRNFGRGTKLAEQKTLISIRYDGLIVSGVMMNLSWSLAAEMETAVPFSFNLLVKDLVILPNDKSGLVRLNNSFAAGSDGYQPFSPGALSLGTQPTSPVMATSAAVTPAASAAVAPVKPTVDQGFTAKLNGQVATISQAAATSEILLGYSVLRVVLPFLP